VAGEIWTSEQFAIDFIQIGPNGSAVKPGDEGKKADPASWWGYGTPVLAVARGVVTEAVDKFENNVPLAPKAAEGEDTPGNHVILDIGDGRYVAYAHLMPKSIVVKVGQHVQVGELIGKLGNTGNTQQPHLHFQLMNRPNFISAHGLPFVLDRQQLEGRIAEADAYSMSGVDYGMVVPIDRTGAGVKRNLMPARNDVFGFNLSR